MKYDIDIIRKYVNEGWLTENKHPDYPLWIYNYSRKTQYERHWDEYTINLRGTVLTETGEVIAHAFPKIFNFEEIENLKEFNSKEYHIFEKLDGSLGIGFFYDGKFIIATRGSFVSDQALKAMNIAKDVLGSDINTIMLNKELSHCTFLFEIIYPENRIVVDYNKETKLVLLAILNHSGNKLDELGYFAMEIFSEIYKVPLVEKLQIYANSFDELKESVPDNKEGYVLVNKYTNQRIKVKGVEYVRLHKIVTNVSNKSIWEYLSSNNISDKNDTIGRLNFLNNIPDEFDFEVTAIIDDLQFKYKMINDTAALQYQLIESLNPRSRAEFANLLTKYVDFKLHSILFKMYDKKEYSYIIWKLIKPKEYYKALTNSKYLL